MMYIQGDVKFNSEISPMTNDIEMGQVFLKELQDLMELWAVTKLDVSVDPYKFMDSKRQAV